ncbi:Rapamycin-insensitive companion of mTOR-like protein [Lotmaria passim]
MATAGMPKEALELLQQYSIDLKDFNKARTRYKTVLEKELVAPSEEEGNSDVLAATKAAQEHLRAAWQEYLTSAQTYFNRIMRTTVDDILDGSQVPPAPSDAGTTTTPTSTVDAPDGGNAKAGSGSVSGPLAAPQGGPSPDAARLSLSVNAVSVPAVGSSICSVGGNGTLVQLNTRAERMSDFCALCEKWYIRNESTFELPQPEGLAALAASAIASVSRLLRLLGMRMLYVCAGNTRFVQTFFANGEAVRWAAFCGDRGLNAEVDALLQVMERILQLNMADPKAFPRVPFGWFYRLRSLLEHPDSVATASPKRRSHAVRIALLLLQHRPDQATAAGLHDVLLNACVSATGGIAPDEAQKVIYALLGLFDAPSTRQYIKVTDLRTIFSPFLSTTDKSTPALLTMQNNAKELIVTVLSTWVGNLWVSSEVTGLRSLIDVLHLPGSLDTKMVIITLFNKLLARLAPHRGIVPMDPWKGFEEDRIRKAAKEAEEEEAECDALLNCNQAVGNSSFACDFFFTDANGEMAIQDDFIPTTKALGYHVLDPLLGRVLMTLNYHGLPYALTELMQTVNKNRVVTGAASSLMQDLFVLMDTVLPQVIVFKLHEAFNRAVGRLANEGSLFVGGLTSQLFRSYKKAGGTAAPGTAETVVPANNTQLPNTALNTPGTLDVDDPTFTTMLRETKVDRQRNCQTWNFDILMALVQGPLHLPHRFRAAQELLKTLVLFYTPSRTASTAQICCTFNNLPTDTVSPQICVLGVELIDLLLDTREGAALLEEGGFVTAIANMLKEVRIGKPVILRRAVVNTRIGQSLLRMTGRLTAHANGLLLMRDYGIFSCVDSMFSKLQGPRLASPTEEDTLHDVCYQLLQYLMLGAVPNYGVCEDIRHTFRAALSNPSNTIRLCAAQQLKKAVWRDLSTSMKWGIETLLQALHDDFFSVIESAFKLLLSICLCSDEGLDYLIECFPTVLMESDVILSHAKQLRLDVLLYRVASRPAGFRFLQCYGWVESELHRWEETESVQYVVMLERLQSANLNAPVAAVTNARVTSGSSLSMSPTSDPSRRHTRSYSDSPAGMYARMGNGTASYLPLLTSSAAMGTNFFPVHFASVLCSSTEGCAMFKHSRLWTRSVQRLLEQPLPPDIVYDDTLSDEEDSSEEESSDDDFHVAADAARYMRQQRMQQRQAQQQVHPGNSTAYYSTGVAPAGGGNNGGAAGGGPGVGGGGASVPANGTLANSAGAMALYSIAGEYIGTGNSLNTMRGLDAFRGVSGTSPGTTTAGMVQSNQTGAANMVNNGGSRGTWGSGGGGSSELAQLNQVTARELELLKKGYLNPSSTKIISAARGYKSSGQSFSLECVGDILTLKDALLCIAEVGSTEVGYGLMLSVPGLQRRFIALSRFASTISVRCLGLLGSAIFARSRRGGDDLLKKGYSVLLNPNAYVSADGVPYAVSFAHMKPSKWVSIARKVAANNTAARHAHAEAIALPGSKDVPRRVWDNIFSLSNPVSCEGAKKVLYKIMKKRPDLFLDPHIRRLCLDVGFTYRMHYKERRFLVDLLDNAQLTAPPTTSTKAPRSRAPKKAAA